MFTHFKSPVKSRTGIFALVVCLLLNSTFAKAQSKPTPTATWFMPGVSYQWTPRLRLLDQGGINPSQHSQFNFAQGFYDLNRHFTLYGGYFFYHASDNGYEENDGFIGAIYNFRVGKFVADDRNVLNLIFPDQGMQKNYYRNRIRVGYPMTLVSRMAKVYVFDEGYYLFDEHRFSRNRAAAGISYKLSKLLTTDLSYWRQSDHYSGSINYFFVQLTVNLFRHPVTQSSK
jgi:hypothetical protein